MRSVISPVAAFMLLFSIVLSSGCGAREKEEKAEGAKPAPTAVKLNIDLEAEQKSQESVDKGYRPWKLDAVEVAKECLINTGTGACDGGHKVLHQDESSAQVQLHTKDGVFKVTLRRLVKPGGIWTATDIEKVKQ